VAATVREVAREAGVSPSTVSRVIRGDRYVSDATVTAVQAAIVKLGYRPDEAARSIRTGSSKAVGYVVSDVTNPVFGTIFKGAEQRLSERGYSLLLAHSAGNSAQEAQAISWLLSRRIDGLILSVSDERARHLKSTIASVPTVLLDRAVKGARADAVRSDHRYGIQAAVHHLVSLGHVRIALLGVTDQQYAMRARREAFTTCPVPPGVELTAVEIESGSISPRVAQDLVDRVLSSPRRPTAVIAAHTPMLMEVLRYVNSHGLLIPRNLSLVACDDLDVCSSYNPPIDVIRRDLENFGRVAAEALVDRLDDPQGRPFEATLPVELVIRGSSAAPLP